MSRVHGLRGASSDALALLAEELERFVVSGADATQLGNDLLSLSALVRGDAGLRRVVTDQSVAAGAKQGLVRDLLAGKVGDPALELASSAVGRRWTAGRDLADALERLGEIAVVRSAGDDVDRLGDELFALGQAVQENPELRDALSDPARSQADKAALIGGLLEGRALPATIRLAQQSVASSYRTVSVALHEYQKVAASVADERVAKVRVARELTEEERRRLTDALSSQYGKAIHLNVVVEPTLIGGMRVEVGDDVIDGTVASRLDDARRRLAG